MRHAWTEPKDGAQRVVRRFLLFPLTLPISGVDRRYERRWLCFALIVQKAERYSWRSIGSFIWKNVGFIAEDSKRNREGS